MRRDTFLALGTLSGLFLQPEEEYEGERVSHGKTDFPPLLAAGFHNLTLSDVERLCVHEFPRSKRRPMLFEGLSEFLELLSSSHVAGTLWLDGSFTTKKPEPKDCDLVLAIDGPTFESGPRDIQVAVDRYFDSGKAWVKKKFHCDAYVRYEWPALHALYAAGLSDRQYWQKQFGRDRSSQEKGIMVLDLGRTA